MPNTITPKTWTNGLFDAATRVDASEVDWAHGWKLYSACPSGGAWCCEDSLTSEELPEGPIGQKADPSPGASIQFSPFTVHQTTACAAGTSRIPANVELNHTASAQWLDTNIEGWVSAGLELGVCGSPGLIDLADVTSDPVDGLRQAITRLIQNRQRDGIYDRPTLHLPGASAPYLSDDYDMLLKFADIAVGPGYGTSGPVVSDTGGWAYITGPVEFSLGKRDLPGEDDMSVRRRNYHDSLSEQVAVVRFDPCGGYRAQFTY